MISIGRTTTLLLDTACDSTYLHKLAPYQNSSGSDRQFYQCSNFIRLMPLWPWIKVKSAMTHFTIQWKMLVHKTPKSKPVMNLVKDWITNTGVKHLKAQNKENQARVQGPAREWGWGEGVGVGGGSGGGGRGWGRGLGGDCEAHGISKS